jgi:rhodanese-related sulfurtransferase
MIKNVDVNDLRAEVEAKTINLVDVREADEYAAGHLPGAINLPLSELVARYDELDKDKAYHIICQMGGRSDQACAFLDSEDYDVINLAGGTSAWVGSLEE